MTTHYPRIVNKGIIGLACGLVSLLGMGEPASAASDYKVIAKHKVAMGDWDHHKSWRVIRFYLPKDFDSNYDAVLQMNVRSTNNSKYNAIYLNPEFSLDEFEGCDPADHDRNRHTRVEYLPHAGHKQWITYHKTIAGDSLQPGDNYMLICSRNKHGGGVHEVDNFYLKDIVLHYREYKPAPEFCPSVYEPVCGMDGQTYSNACEAESMGVEIHHEGQCSDF